ncbi:MAG: fumarylacetoacetate hydrolase family protein [Calditrichaeota bacterium]|nr:fumarylacetoacetate hydrolase family protein [Calditrichota bacterium]
MKNFLNIDNQSELYCSKVICVARNYAAHAAELNNEIPAEPVFFIKPNSSLSANGHRIFLPGYSQSIHHEVELAVVIGREGKKISIEKAEDYILGYAVAIDLTARDIQNKLKEKSHPWEKAKAFDQSCPISTVKLKKDIGSVADLPIRLSVNHEMRQNSRTGLMINKIPKLIANASEIFTLCEGDVILTGTPEGVGIVSSKDIIEAEIEGIAKLNLEVN